MERIPTLLEEHGGATGTRLSLPIRGHFRGIAGSLRLWLLDGRRRAQGRNLARGERATRARKTNVLDAAGHRVARKDLDARCNVETQHSIASKQRWLCLMPLFVSTKTPTDDSLPFLLKLTTEASEAFRLLTHGLFTCRRVRFIKLWHVSR